MGSSNTNGYGIPQDQNFESIVERALNQESWPGTAGHNIEIMNSAFANISPIKQFDEWRYRSSFLKPDIVLFVTHYSDKSWTANQLSVIARRGVVFREAYLHEILRRGHVTRRTPQVFAARRLKPYESELIGWTYRTLGSLIAASGALPVAVMVPVPGQLPVEQAAWTEQRQQLMDAGFVVLDLQAALDGHDPDELALPDDPDRHLNILGHKLIAEALVRALRENRQIGEAAASAAGTAPSR